MCMCVCVYASRVSNRCSVAVPAAARLVSRVSFEAFEHPLFSPLYLVLRLSKHRHTDPRTYIYTHTCRHERRTRRTFDGKNCLLPIHIDVDSEEGKEKQDPFLFSPSVRWVINCSTTSGGGDGGIEVRDSQSGTKR